MKLLFFGTPEFAIPSLKKLNEHFTVIGVVTQPDKPSGRNLKLTPPPIKLEAERLQLPVYQPEKVNDPTWVEFFRSLQPDLGVVVAYGRFLKDELLSTAQVGYFINLHPSLLPRWRGPSPIQTAIIEGDTETGVTIMKISAEMDAGDILLQQKTVIYPDENAEELSNRLSIMGADLLIEAVELIRDGKAYFYPQDPSKVTYCHLLEKHHGKIQWSHSAQQIHNLVRGCYPWPIAYTWFKGEILRIHKTVLISTDESTPSMHGPGTVIETTNDLCIVQTGKGCLGIHTLQSPGRKALPFREYRKGRPISVGDVFEEVE